MISVKASQAAPAQLVIEKIKFVQFDKSVIHSILESEVIYHFFDFHGKKLASDGSLDFHSIHLKFKRIIRMESIGAQIYYLF